MMDRRIGLFDIPTETIHHQPEFVKRIMGECIITRAECMFDRDAIFYIAISDHFRKIPIGEKAPKYRIIATMDEEDPIRFVELKE